MNKEIPLETLKILLDRWHHANQGELSNIELLITIESLEEYDFINIKDNENNVEEATVAVQEINEQLEGYGVIGIIKIPKINIEYPILEKTDKTSLKLSCFAI